MTIRVLQNRTTVRPVGVVKSPKISAEAELYSSIAKLGTKYMGIAYQRGVQEAKQAGGEEALNTKLTVLDPKDGFIKKVDSPDGFGRIATDAFNTVMRTRSEKAITTQMKKALAELMYSEDGKFYADPIAYQNAAVSKIAGYVEATPDEFKAYVQDEGSKLLSAGMTQVTANQFSERMDRIDLEGKQVLGDTISEYGNDLIENGWNQSKYDKLRNTIVAEAKAKSLKYSTEQGLLNLLNIKTMQSVISNWAVNKDKQEVNNLAFAFLSRFRATEYGSFPEIKKVWDSLEGKEQSAEEIKQHINYIQARSSDGTNNEITSVGNTPNNRKKMDSHFNVGDNIEKNPLDKIYTFEGIDVAKIQVADALPHGYYEQIQQYLNNNISDPEGKIGFKLFQDYIAITHKTVDGNDYIQNSMYSDDMILFFESMKDAVNLQTTPAEFNTARELYNKMKNSGDDTMSSFMDKLVKELNIEKENPTINDVTDEITERILNEDVSWMPFYANGINEKTARQYAHVALLRWQQDIYRAPQNKKYSSFGDIINSLARTIYGQEEYDEGIIDSNLQVAVKKIAIQEPNPEGGKRISFGGMIAETPENISVGGINSGKKTLYNMNNIWKNYEINYGKERFINDVERIANELNAMDFESEYTYGQNLFLQPTEASTVENPRFKVWQLTKEGGWEELMIPVIAFDDKGNKIDVGLDHQLIIDVSDYKLRYDSDIVYLDAREKEGFRFTGAPASYIYHGLKDMDNYYKERKYKAFGPFELMAYPWADDNDPLLMESYDEYRLRKGDRQQTFWNQDLITKIKQFDIPDIMHRIVFGNYARATINTGIVSLERNNPINIRYSKSNDWVGKLGDDGSGFESFGTNAEAYRAGYKLFHTYNEKYFKHKMTLKDLITKWAPPAENDTESYINHVSKSTGINRDTILDLNNLDAMKKILLTMTKHEIGVTAFSAYDFWEQDIVEGLRM